MTAPRRVRRGPGRRSRQGRGGCGDGGQGGPGPAGGSACRGAGGGAVFGPEADPAPPSTVFNGPDKAHAELLQEVRVARTGVQILLGFLMTFAFSPRFAARTGLQAGQYVSTLLMAFGAAAFLTAPAPFHRVVFRCGKRTQLSACRTGRRWWDWSCSCWP
ncbi:DUF6328 family protein [Streptomyces sp. NPDC001389]|uniref:DUF6328 family protein n=1 Tax=Streptomyces sp. NPDC001389 TaxID=3364569 RepID=UPI0036C42A4E